MERNPVHATPTRVTGSRFDAMACDAANSDLRPEERKEETLAMHSLGFDTRVLICSGQSERRQL